VDRRELLIFIQPQIVVGEESQQQAQSDMERRYNASKPTRDFADGILPGKPRSEATVPDKQAPAIPAASQRPYLRYPTRR
jgi:LDH2 family malate/lactate/ureidoglycolate dehydrogenase